MSDKQNTTNASTNTNTDNISIYLSEMNKHIEDSLVKSVKITMLEESNKKLNEQNKYLKKDINHYKEHNEKLTKDNDMLKKSKMDMDSYVINLIDQNKQLNMSLAGLMAELDHLRYEYFNLKSEYHRLDSECNITDMSCSDSISDSNSNNENYHSCSDSDSNSDSDSRGNTYSDSE